MSDLWCDSRVDLVLKNATVCTVDGDLPRAEAVAIRGNEIVAVGRDGDVDPFIGSGTRVYDLDGRLVLPGCSHCHTHFLLDTIMAATAFDLCVLDGNILDIDPQQILETKVVMTVFDGNVVFDQL